MLFALIEIIRGHLTPYPFWIKDIGKRGEFLARRHYRRRGYHLVFRNSHEYGCEIDAVMANWREVICLEVKTRRRKPSHDLVTRVLPWRQERRLVRTMERFQHVYPSPFSWRIDLVLIVLNPKAGISIDTLTIH